jgi:hypothetical protein
MAPSLCHQQPWLTVLHVDDVLVVAAAAVSKRPNATVPCPLRYSM